MPSPRAAEILQMPHPRDWNGGQMPRSSLGVVWGFGPGGGGELGAAGVDWCITFLWHLIKNSIHFLVVFFLF